MMDHEKFDALSRAFAPAISRRKLFRMAGIAGLIAAFRGRLQPRRPIAGTSVVAVPPGPGAGA
jgi:hypothetical protein